MKEQIAKSPFVREEFLNLAQKFSNADVQQFKNHLIEALNGLKRKFLKNWLQYHIIGDMRLYLQL